MNDGRLRVVQPGDRLANVAEDGEDLVRIEESILLQQGVHQLENIR